MTKKTAPKKVTKKKDIKPKSDVKLKELNLAVKEEKDKYLRLFAEFENYKKRTSKERIELYKTEKVIFPWRR